MKPFLVKFQFFAVFLIVSLQYSCVPLALTGSNNNSTLLGALVAASSISPGLNDVPRDESGQPIIPDNKSYIRIKFQDDPLPPPSMDITLPTSKEFPDNRYRIKLIKPF